MSETLVDVWTVEQIKALGVRTDLTTACAIVYGCKRDKAYAMFHAGELAFPALKCGRRVQVPVAGILAALGLNDTEAA